MLCVQGVIQHWLSAFLWWFIPQQLSILPTSGKAVCMCVSFNVFQYFFLLAYLLLSFTFVYPIFPNSSFPRANQTRGRVTDGRRNETNILCNSIGYIGKQIIPRAHTLFQIRTFSFILSRGNGVKENEKTDHRKKSIASIRCARAGWSRQVKL